jgi:hypothetical protein
MQIRHPARPETFFRQSFSMPGDLDRLPDPFQAGFKSGQQAPSLSA